MPAAKKSKRAFERHNVSLPQEDAAWVKAKAKRRSRSFSGIVAEAVRMQREFEARGQLLDMLGGPSPEDEADILEELAG